MTEANKGFGEFLASKADVVIGLERAGGLSATEILATRSWFKQRLGRLTSSGGRPTNPQWTIKRQIPLNPQLWERLKEIAGDCADLTGSRVGPGQLAAFLLEDAVVAVTSSGSDLPAIAAAVTTTTHADLQEPEDPRARGWRMPGVFAGIAA